MGLTLPAHRLLSFDAQPYGFTVSDSIDEDNLTVSVDTKRDVDSRETVLIIGIMMVRWK